MPNTIQLLKQIRAAMNTVSHSSDNPEHQTLLTAADLMINELLLLEHPEFYLQVITAGKTILKEGQSLVKKIDEKSITSPKFRGNLNKELRAEIINDEINKLIKALSDIATCLNENNAIDEKDYLIRLSTWHSSLYKHSLTQVKNSQFSKETITQEVLLTYLEKKFPQWTGLKITKFLALYGGFSKNTILFETQDQVNGQQSMVIRAEQGVDLLHYEGSNVTKEFPMIQLMEHYGLPVAKPLWLEEDASLLGRRFLVSKKAMGRNYGGNLGTSENLSEGIRESMLTTFYKMHNIRIDPSNPLAQQSHLDEWLSFKTVSEATEYYVNSYIPDLITRANLKSNPDLIRATKWAQQNIPEVNEPPTLIHMDYSFNNLLFDGNQITAVLDWETSRLGDPAEDIIHTQGNLENFYTMTEFLDKYKIATNKDISEYRLAYAKVTKFLVVAVACLNAHQLIDRNDETPIDFAFMAYKFLPLLCANLNELIADAENLKNKTT